MGIIRVKKEEKYTIVSNEMLLDKRLSWAAKGILTYLLSKKNNWKCRVEQLKTASKNGRDSTNAALAELLKYGYAKRSEKVRKEKGKFLGYDYTIYEKPLLETRNGLPVTENQKLVSTDRVNTDRVNILSKDNISDSKESPDDIPKKKYKKEIVPILEKILNLWTFKKHRLYNKQNQPTALMLKVHNFILDIKSGYFLRGLSLDKDFLSNNKKAVEIIKSLKNKDLKDIEKMVIRSIKRYIKMKSNSYEPLNKKILTNNIDQFLYNDNAEKSFFIHCLNGPPKKRYEEISRVNSAKIKASLPEQVVNDSSFIKKDNWDDLEFWNKIKALYLWHSRNGKYFQKNNPSFYTYMGSFKRFLTVYHEFSESFDTFTLGNFGYNNKTWYIFKTWLIEKYDIKLELERKAS